MTRGLVKFSWAPVAGAQQYLVYRDGAVIGSPSASSTIWNDFQPLLGTHDYCVRATATGMEPSDLCCSHASAAFPPSTPHDLAASDNLFGSIRLTWNGVDGATHYSISRDGQFISDAAETTYLDPGLFGTHQYCLQAVNDIGASGKVCATGAALDTGAYVRLSWGTCSPQVSQQNDHGPGIYTLVVSARGIPLATVGHDTKITLAPGVPDAWRFDDAGCQGMTRLDPEVEGLGPGCPALLGLNPLAITNYHEDTGGSGSAELRLAVTYDERATDPHQRYVLWKIDFDHTHSVPGTDDDAATCDGIDLPLEWTVSSQVLLTYGQLLLTAAAEPFDLPVKWTGLVDPPVSTRITTWGKLKSLYR